MAMVDSWWWIWCLALVTGFGACIGSFINVVIYRVPRDIPLGRPRWSFCPNCHTQLRVRDNIPVLSYVLLRGHCRTCRCRIPPRYVIVEVITIITFVVLFDAFFVASRVGGITADSWTTVSYRFYNDWVIFAAHAILFGCLIAMSVIDLEAYWVDIRYTHLAAVCGFVGHALWAGPRGPDWPQPDPNVGAAALMALPVIVLTHGIVTAYWNARCPQPPDTAEPAAEPDRAALHLGPRSLRPTAWFAIAALAATLGLEVWHLATPRSGITPTADGSFWIRALPALSFILVVLLGGSMIVRDADQEIEDAIEAERHSARRTALLELGILIPTAVAFVAGLMLLGRGGLWQDRCSATWQWSPGGGLHPVAGLGTAAAGFIIAGAIGWTVRIGFTGLLGKEAFGSGDIHIMAAAGAVAGWEVVLIGFLLSSPLALFGKIVTLPFKRGRTLPMGPWLTLALFLAVLLRDPLRERYFAPLARLFTLWFADPG